MAILNATAPGLDTDVAARQELIVANMHFQAAPLPAKKDLLHSDLAFAASTSLYFPSTLMVSKAWLHEACNATFVCRTVWAAAACV